MARQMNIFESFLRDKSRWATNSAMRLAGNAEVAEELVQEAFFRTLKHWHRYDRNRPIEYWFTTILGNLYIDLRRRKENQFIGLDSPVEGGDAITFGELLPACEEPLLDRLERMEQAQMLEEALQKLNPEHRELLMLCDVDGLDGERAAAVLKIPAGTVRSRLFRARQAFRNSWHALTEPSC